MKEEMRMAKLALKVSENDNVGLRRNQSDLIMMQLGIAEQSGETLNRKELGFNYQPRLTHEMLMTMKEKGIVFETRFGWWLNIMEEPSKRRLNVK